MAWQAAVNVRKGKKVVMFELTIKCAYEGTSARRAQGSSCPSAAASASCVRPANTHTSTPLAQRCCIPAGKQGDDTCAGTISVFEVLPDDVRDGDYEVTVRSPSSAAPKARELMRTKGPAALKAKLTEFLAALTKRDGDERALAEDKVRALCAAVCGGAGRGVWHR